MDLGKLKDIVEEDICKIFGIDENASTCTNDQPATKESIMESILAAKRLLGCIVTKPPEYMTKGFDFGKPNASFGVVSLWKKENYKFRTFNILYGMYMKDDRNVVIEIYKGLRIYSTWNGYKAVWMSGYRSQRCKTLKEARKIIDIVKFFNQQVYEVKL